MKCGILYGIRRIVEDGDSLPIFCGTENRIMKGKRNQGFSLVELIVVIAIMAVLVGVLAPAYLKYVEKSRKSKDLQLIDNIVKTGTTIATDPDNEYYIPAGAIFQVTCTSGALDVDIICDEMEADRKTDAINDWKDTSGMKSATAKFSSKDWKKSSGSFQGIVNPAGTIKWDISSINSGDVFDKIISYSKDFANYFETITNTSNTNNTNNTNNNEGNTTDTNP